MQPSKTSYLTETSGFKVVSRPDTERKGVEIFEFSNDYRMVYSVHTYRKAKVFAQGVMIGRLQVKVEPSQSQSQN